MNNTISTTIIVTPETKLKISYQSYKVLFKANLDIYIGKRKVNLIC